MNLAPLPAQQPAPGARPVETDPLLTPAEVGARLRVGTQTLRKWRMQGKGPRFLKAGAVVRYRLSVLAAWIEHREISGTPRSAAGPV